VKISTGPKIPLDGETGDRWLDKDWKDGPVWRICDRWSPGSRVWSIEKKSLKKHTHNDKKP